MAAPTSLAFVRNGDLLVLEKNSGQVRRIMNGVDQGAILNLGVNAASERGLLGIALHPNFIRNRFVYLFWTCHAPISDDPFSPATLECPDPTLGDDTEELLAVPLLANRVGRFVWGPSGLVIAGGHL